MGSVISHLTMSLDGFVATPDDDPQELFDWYAAGDVEVPSASDEMTFRVDPASAEVLGGLIEQTGVFVAGRHLFYITDGWGDNHPYGVPVVVVTHHAPEDAERWPRTRFAPDVESAISLAQQIAGDAVVYISSPTIAQQALDLGLIDDVWISLAPVLFGTGTSYFADLGRHVQFDDPDVVQGRRALHLRYRVRRAA